MTHACPDPLDNIVVLTQLVRVSLHPIFIPAERVQFTEITRKRFRSEYLRPFFSINARKVGKPLLQLSGCFKKREPKILYLSGPQVLPLSAILFSNLELPGNVAGQYAYDPTAEDLHTFSINVSHNFPDNGCYNLKEKHFSFSICNFRFVIEDKPPDLISSNEKSKITN